MRCIYLLMTMGYLFTLSLLIACHSDDISPSIDLNTLCKTFEGDELRLYLNGEEYSSITEKAVLIYPEMLEDKNKYPINSGQMLLEILPIFPETIFKITDEAYTNLIFAVDVTTTSEKVILKGVYNQSQYYTVDLNGEYSNEILTLYLTYKTKRDKITSQAFVFDLTRESIDLSQLFPKKEYVEYKGFQYPIRNFILDAISPVIKSIRNRIGGSVRIKFHENGSIQIGVKGDGELDFTDIPGKHGYYFHESDWGYLSVDTVGLKYLSPILDGKKFGYRSEFYSWRARQIYFAPIYLTFNDNDDLLITLEEPLMFAFGKYINTYAQRFHDSFNTGDNNMLSDEEVEKLCIVSSLLLNKEIDFILFRGIKE